MTESETQWYARPIFSVTDIQASLQHYCKLLGFEQSWTYKENDRTIVTQVNKGDFEIILTENLDRVGSARAFVSLMPAELEQLQNDISARQIPTERTHWGYPIIKIRDPDGNELLFPLDEE